jgi:lysophospholipase L1-like esterase
VSLTNNTVTNATNRPSIGILVNQHGSLEAKSPTVVSGNTVAGVLGGGAGSGSQNGHGIAVFMHGNGTVEPVVQNNSVSSTSAEAFAIGGHRLVGSKLSGNSVGANTVATFALSGRLVSDLTLTPTGGVIGVPVSLGSWFSSGLNVAPGATLTISSGTIVKVSQGAQLGVQGSLAVNGAAGSPVVFTSMRDDAIGGDTNRDGNATTPVTTDWSGIAGSNSAEAPRLSLAMSHTELRYSPGLSVSASHGAETGLDPVVSAVSVSNSTFSLGGSVTISGILGSVSLTNNTVTNATNRPSIGILVNQHGSLEAKSPTVVSGNTVAGALGGAAGSSSNSGHGIAVFMHGNGTVEPVVQNNTVSSTSAEAYAIYAHRLNAAKLSGNSAGANTAVAFALSGTLVTDLTLTPTGGVIGVPASLGTWNGATLSVASGATLTVAAGTIVKASQGATLSVLGSLVVNGAAGSPVVFTSMRDDARGGDTNRDLNATTPAPCDWQGIITQSGGAIEADHIEVHYACTGFSVVDGGAAAATNAKISQTDTAASTSGWLMLSGSVANVSYGVRCSGVCRADARFVNWGTSTGPAPYGSGPRVDLGVQVAPWEGYPTSGIYAWEDSTPDNGSMTTIPIGQDRFFNVKALVYYDGVPLPTVTVASSMAGGALAGDLQCQVFNQLETRCRIRPNVGDSRYFVNARMTLPSGEEWLIAFSFQTNPATYSRYVALGDSYSSGEGAVIGEDDNDDYRIGTNVSSNRCHRSRNAYPYLLASDSSLGIGSMVHAACSGALTWNLRNDGSLTVAKCAEKLDKFGDPTWSERWENFYPQQGQDDGSACMQWPDDPVLGDAPDQIQQVDVVNQFTDLVTITVGGNDAGFSDILQGCLIRSLLPLLGGPRAFLLSQLLNACPQGEFEANVAQLRPQLVGIFQEIKANAKPTAHILVGGYPRFYPESPWDNSVACDALSIPSRMWINDKIRAINTIIREAADQAKVTFVDLYGAFDGHEHCRPGVQEWMNGMVNLDERLLPAELRNYINHSYHPNNDGQRAFAAFFRRFM